MLMMAKNKEVSFKRRVFVGAHGQLGLRQEKNEAVHGPAIAGHAATLESGVGEDYNKRFMEFIITCPENKLSERYAFKRQ